MLSNMIITFVLFIGLSSAAFADIKMCSTKDVTGSSQGLGFGKQMGFYGIVGSVAAPVSDFGIYLLILA